MTTSADSAACTACDRRTRHYRKRWIARSGSRSTMRTIDEVNVAGVRVLVRVDLNVPLDGSRITDDGRIQASLPTIRALLARGARVVVCAHLGRPGGQPDARYSLAPVARRLSELIGTDVTLAA